MVPLYSLGEVIKFLVFVGAEKEEKRMSSNCWGVLAHLNQLNS